MTTLSAGSPLMGTAVPVGHRSVSLAFDARSRPLDAEVWYPATSTAVESAEYEVIPGVRLRSSVASSGPRPADGRHPLVVMSHGRTGTRVSYTQLCESLAGCGAVVVAPDHAGDTLGAWLSGTQVDDATNEIQRLTDARQLVDAFLQGHSDLPGDLEGLVDRRSVAVVGHSYGAFTAYGAVGGARGVPAHPAVRAVVGLQPYLRSLSENALGRVGSASLLVVGGTDDVTPAATDADRGWEFVPGRPSWRLDLPGHGHQACSDIALYAELVEHVPDLPQLVRDYLLATAAGTSGPGIRPWRDVLRDQVVTTWAFLSGVFAGEPQPDAPDLGDSDSVLQRR